MFHIAVNNEQQGPFTLEELATKGLTPDTMVWKEGMDNWMALKDVPELAGLMPKMPPPPPPTPPPVQAAVPPPTATAASPSSKGQGGTLETGEAEMPNILDHELANDAKEVFTNIQLSSEGVFDVRSTTYDTNRATVMSILGGGLLLMGSFFNSAFGIGALITTLLFVAVPFAASGFAWLEMKKLLVLNGGKQGGNFFKWAGFLMLGAAGFTAILGLIIGFTNPFSLLSMYSTIELILVLVGLCLIATVVFLILAGTKVTNYKAKYFKEFSYALFAAFPVAFLFRYLAQQGSGGVILNLLGGIFYLIPFALAVLIFQRAGKNNNQVT